MSTCPFVGFLSFYRFHNVVTFEIFLQTTLVVQVGKQSIGYVDMFVWTDTFELNDNWPRFLARWFILTLSRSSLKVKVKVHGRMRKQDLSNCWDARPWRSECRNKYYGKADLHLKL